MLIIQQIWRSTQEAEGTPLERVQVVNSGARVQIPPSPFGISNEFSGLSYCLIIKVHSFCCPSFYRSSLTSISHSFVIVKHLFELFWKSCFSKLSGLLLRSDSFHSITPKCLPVNTFFQLFSFLKIRLKKERRKRDLNPRAGCPTYTLSRGASSASWVFLHFWSAFPRYSVIRRFCRRIVHYNKVLAECQRLFSFYWNNFFPHFSFYIIEHYMSYKFFPSQSITTITGKSSTSNL